MWKFVCVKALCVKELYVTKFCAKGCEKQETVVCTRVVCERVAGKRGFCVCVCDKVV